MCFSQTGISCNHKLTSVIKATLFICILNSHQSHQDRLLLPLTGKNLSFAWKSYSNKSWPLHLSLKYKNKEIQGSQWLSRSNKIYRENKYCSDPSLEYAREFQWFCSYWVWESTQRIFSPVKTLCVPTLNYAAKLLIKKKSDVKITLSPGTVFIKGLDRWNVWILLF